MPRSFFWGAIVVDALRLFIEEDLSTSDYSVFMHLCNTAEPETNISSEKQKDIVKNFKDLYDKSINKSTVSKSIRKLTDKTFIVKPNNKSGYMVNPSIFYFGDGKKQQSKIYLFAKYIKEDSISEFLLYDAVSRGVKYAQTEKYHEENTHAIQFDYNDLLPL